MDLFTDAEKSFFASCIHDVHETFCRDITVCSEPIRTVVDPNVNPLYQFPRDASKVVLTPVSTVINARILAGTPSNETLADGTKYNDVPVAIPAGKVRIKVEKQYHQLISDCKRIDIDGMKYTVESHSRPHGIFETNYYTYFLRPIEED